MITPNLIKTFNLRLLILLLLALLTQVTVAENVSGTYTVTEYDGASNVHADYEMTISMADEASGKVEIFNFWNCGMTVTGYLQEDGFILVPTGQQIYDYPSYGPVYMFAQNDDFSDYAENIILSPTMIGFESSYWVAKVSAGIFGYYKVIMTRKERAVLGEGAYGNTLSYILYDDGELDIYGEGALEYSYSIPWSSYRSQIKKVVIGDGVTSISKNVFNNYTSLESVTIPGSVKSISESAFSGCNAVRELIYAEGTTVALKTGITSIERLVLPNTLVEFSDYAFQNCKNLVSLIIPNSVTRIGYQTFFGCRFNTVIAGSHIKGGSAFDTRPLKTIWLCNTSTSVPKDDKLVGQYVNLVSNNQFNIENQTVYPYLSSMFEVDGVIYVPVNPSERTCDAIHCQLDETSAKIKIGSTVSYRGVDFTVQNVHKYLAHNNKYVKSVSIDVAGNVGEYAFGYCHSMEKLSVNCHGDIGKYAFYYCDKLLIAGISTEGGVLNGAFAHCANMSAMNIASSVSLIGESAFSGCNALNEFTIPASTAEIGNSAFSSCKSLTSIIVPATLKTIGKSAFNNCSSLSKVIIEDREDVLTLGNNESCKVFDSCPLDEVYIGGKISYASSASAGYSPFYRNTSLRSVTISDRENRIYPYEFYGCSNLQTVKIGDGVTQIGSWAFSGCSNLTSFRFGENVKEICQEAFSDCISLTGIASEAAVPPVCGGQALEDINKWDCTLYVPEANIADYQAASQWKDFFFVKDILEKVETFRCGDNITASFLPKTGVFTLEGNGAMYDYSENDIAPWEEYIENISQITVSDGITSIGDYSFGYTNISSIFLPASIEKVGIEAFAWCENLKEINVDEKNPYYFSKDGVLYDRRHSTGYINFKHDNDVVLALYPCGKEGNFQLPGNVGMIGNAAFFDCQKLSAISMPSGSLVEIGEFAFQLCAGLKQISIPSSVVYIDDYAFSWCEDLQSVYLGSGLEGYGSGVFWHSKALTAINVDKANQVYSSVDGVIYSKDGKTLDRCPEGRHFWLNIPEGGESIGENGYHYGSFYGCEILSGITMPEGLKHVGRESFYGCTGLKSLTLPSTVSSINEYAFYGCSSLRTLTCQASKVPETATNAFWSTPRQSGILYVPVESVQDYTGAAPWNEWGSIKPYGTGTVEVDGIVYSYDLATQTATLVDGRSVLGVVYVQKSIEVSGYECIVTTIGEDAFWKCQADAIHIPETVHYIGYSAFYGSNLSHIYCYATDKMVVAEKNADEIGAYHILHVPASLVDKYKQDQPWNYFIRAVLPLTEKETSIAFTQTNRPSVKVCGNGTLVVSGIVNGECVTLYSIDGRLLDTALAKGEEVSLHTNVKSGSVVIVKVGGDTQKVMVR